MLAFDAVGGTKYLSRVSGRSDECGEGNWTAHYYGLPAGVYYAPVFTDAEASDPAVGPYTLSVNAID